MPITPLVPTSIGTVVGTWTNLSAASVSVSDDIRASTNVAGNNFTAEITDAPADYGTANSVVLGIEWSINGNATRAKNMFVELLQGGAVVASFVTPALTGAAADLLHSSPAISLAATKAQVDAWQYRITMQEGGGMADSVSVGVDLVRVNLNYNVAVAAPDPVDLSFTGTVPRQSLSAQLEYATPGVDVAFAGTVPLQSFGASLEFVPEAEAPDPATLTISGNVLDWAPVPAGLTSQRIERRKVG